MRRNKIKVNFVKHEILIYFLYGIVFLGFLTNVHAREAMTIPKKAGIDDAIEILNNALIDSRDNKKGNITINMNDSSLTVQAGDLVGVKYCLKLETGEILRTNIKELLDDKEIPLSENYIESNIFSEVEVLAGEMDAFPGLHSGVIGMKKGETKKIVVSPEEGYGPRKEDRIKTFPSLRLLPKKTSINQEKFHELFNMAPVVGDSVHLVPYFYHKITEINEMEVVLEAEIKGTYSLKSEIGDIKITPEENNIAITLEPQKGADFVVGNETGKIASVDDNVFTVDFNHPLAGKNLVLDMTVDSIIEASRLKDWEISWHEDYDEGLQIAKGKDKPAVIVLYSDTCGWCEKLFVETMTDPRVTLYKDDFIWIKANEKSYPELMELYSQNSSPAIVFLGKQGEEIEKLSGFKYAPMLREKLSNVLYNINVNNKKAS